MAGKCVLVVVAGGVVGLGGGAEDAADGGEEGEEVEVDVMVERVVQVPGPTNLAVGAGGPILVGHVFEDGVLGGVVRVAVLHLG